MTIVRSPRIQRDFTIVSNAVCLDPRLSMRALGLLVRMLSRPDDWHTNSEALSREFDCGRDQTRSVLRELADAGYMQLRKEQGDNGQFSSKWYVFDEPQAPATEKPGPGNRGLETRTPVDQALLPRTDLTRTDTNPPTPKGERSPVGFEEFWKAWPASPRKVGKKQCSDKWARKKFGAITEEILVHVMAMKMTKQWRDGFEPAPLTYLNGERWKDGVPVGSTSSDAFAGVI